MEASIKQQIVISGVGGQGVLFVTRLLAEAAMMNGNPVLTSETHGMAQRGGIVVSHLKVGDFSSPMIRPGAADGLIAMKAETVAQFSGFLTEGGWAAVNGDAETTGFAPSAIDADRLAADAGNPRSVNIVMLGLAMAVMEKTEGGGICSMDDIRVVMENRLKGKQEMLKAALTTLEAGYGARVGAEV